MKAFFIAAAFVPLLLWANTPPSPDGGQVGRYQLASGTLPDIKADGAPTVFRIDTATGRVWNLCATPLRSETGTVANVHVWTELHEINGELYRAAMASLKPRE